MRLRRLSRASRSVALLLATCPLFGLAGCAGNLVSNPPVYEWHKDIADAPDARFHLTLAKPVSAASPPLLVVFVSGDGGLMGVSKAILQHLADTGYFVAGFSSREATKRTRSSGGRTPYASSRWPRPLRRPSVRSTCPPTPPPS